MAQENIVQEGVDRVNDAVDSINSEFQRVQKRIDKQRKSVEKQFKASRRDFERETRKQVKKFRRDWDKNPTVKRTRAALSDAQKQLEKSFDSLLAAFQIASKSDVQRIDRKLNQISKKLKDIEKARANGNGTSATL